MKPFLRIARQLAPLTNTLLCVIPLVVLAASNASAEPVETPRSAGPLSISLRERAVIQAEPAKIWQLLVELEEYETWNPWVVWAKGKAEPGADVSVDVIMNGGTMRAEHKVLAVEPMTRFCWRDAGWNASFVYGQRCRWLTERPDGSVLFEQEVLLDGVLAWLAKLMYGDALTKGMAAETAALKAKAEAP